MSSVDGIESRVLWRQLEKKILTLCRVIKKISLMIAPKEEVMGDSVGKTR